MRPVIMVVDSQVSVTSCWRQFLAQFACGVIEAVTVGDLDQLMTRRQSLVVILNVDTNHLALEAALQIHDQSPRAPVILVMQAGSEELAVAAFRAGVSDYFHFPGEALPLLAAVNRLRASRVGPWQPVEEPAGSEVSEVKLVGTSLCMETLKSKLAWVAGSDCNVLVTGETGTGKELVASAIHRMSSRNGKPFVCVNCAAIPDALVESELFGYERGAFTGAHTRKAGWLETTHEGTMFLDEIGDMSPFTQAKLLRVIERKEFHRLGGNAEIRVNVRFIAATHRNLEDMAEEGKFRQDLYYRLNIAMVHLPPLRDRKEDIPLLARHYMRELNAQNQKRVTEMSDEVWNCLMSYDWPGNIRELKNLLESVFVNSAQGKICFEDLPEQFRKRFEKSVSSGGQERQQLLEALLRTKWNKSKAAQELHWSRMTLYRKMHKHRIFARPGTAGQ